MKAMTTEDSVSRYAIAGIEICLLTGCRASEVETMKLRNIHIEQKVINLDDSKTGPCSVEMTEEVIEIIESMNRLSNFELVFLGKAPGKLDLRKYGRKCVHVPVSMMSGFTTYVTVLQRPQQCMEYLCR